MTKNNKSDIAEMHDSVSLYVEFVAGLRRQFVAEGFTPETAELLVVEAIRANQRGSNE